MVNWVRGNFVRSLPWLALPCVALAQGCDFIGDVSLGNNDDNGGNVATGGTGSPTGGTGRGGSDSGGADDSGGGSLASGGTSPSTGGASNGGSGSSNGGTGTAGAGEGGVPSGGSSSAGTSSGGTPQGGAAGSGAGAGSSSGAGGAGGTVSGSYLGCHFIGGIDRVVVSKRDVANNRCLGLVLWDGQTQSGDLAVPENWAVEGVIVGPADECPSRTGTRLQATVSGSLTFLSTIGGIPEQVAVDATITFAAGQPVAGTERLMAESVDVGPSCNQVCVGEGPTPRCNDNPMHSSIHGRCTAAGTCVCNEGYELNPATGKCL